MDKATENLKNKMVPMGQLMDLLECPVCTEVVRVPFKQCQRGHLVCGVCAKSLRSCPSCRGAFSLDNPACMKKLIEALPRKCRYNANGCTEIVESINDHEAYCGHRPITCLECDVKKQVLQLKTHLETDHSDEPYYKNVNFSVRLSSFRESEGVYELPIFAMSTSFWLSIKLSLTEMDIDFKGVFVGKPSVDYFITLKFEKDGVGPRITLKAAEDLNQSNDDKEQDDTCSTKIFRRMVQRCIDHDGDLVFDCQLNSKPNSSLSKRRETFHGYRHTGGGRYAWY